MGFFRRMCEKILKEFPTTPLHLTMQQNLEVEACVESFSTQGESSSEIGF